MSLQTEKKGTVISMRKLVERVAISAVAIMIIAIVVIAKIIENPDYWTTTSTVALIVGVIAAAIAAACNWLLNQ